MDFSLSGKKKIGMAFLGILGYVALAIAGQMPADAAMAAIKVLIMAYLTTEGLVDISRALKKL